ncbi:PA0069 family radical SAM protein [Rurimicrobium arvi]|uniref:PA0069 family radical SAM protein n=1 Tax=Rurimicrobium arvi TaxID=2049916 RepID=A0ABP8MEM1_9BACT
MISQKADNEYEAGRGAQYNHPNRFLKGTYIREHVEGVDDWEQEVRKTEFIYDNSKTIVNEVKSPDVGMAFSANPYQGCEHGCIYCYARNSHEYWGYSAGLDFESRIIVKKNAPALLRRYFDNRNYEPAVISLSGNTDCYQPIERKMRLTRQMLEICLEYRNPVGIITKNALILRDLDLLESLAAQNLVRVYFSVTGTDEKLRLALEPRTATYKNRLNVMSALSAKGIPVGVMNAPIIPGLNDHQMHDVLQRAAAAGATTAGYTMVRLNGAIGPIFEDWLRKTFPDRAEKVWNMICSCHAGNVNDSRFGTRMTGEGNIAELIRTQFALYCRKFGLNKTSHSLSLDLFRRSKGGQTFLFD